MNADGHYLKWNVAIAGDNKAPGKWTVNTATVGKITRTKKPPHSDGYIDIGSLRSGRDILCDVKTENLTSDQLAVLLDAAEAPSPDSALAILSITWSLIYSSAVF